MFYISHRGNIHGPNKRNENKVEYIENASNQGFDVEIDVWYYKNNFYLGHDKPLYKVKKSFLLRKNFWCHAKNLDALVNLEKIKSNYFWHQNDDYTITSKGYIWAYPGKKLNKNAIYVLPEWCKKFDTTLKYCGVCSDYIEKYRKKILTLKKK
tara:strand:- start:1504 stop:1962 length:459 start_codon:yes stop_codon:yes gene_type:complete